MATQPTRDALRRARRQQGSTSVDWESGAAYYDGTAYLYVVYGVDGDWQATRADLGVTLSTAAGQTGTRPSTIAALEALTYS